MWWIQWLIAVVHSGDYQESTTISSFTFVHWNCTLRRYFLVMRVVALSPIVNMICINYLNTYDLCITIYRYMWNTATHNQHNTRDTRRVFVCRPLYRKRVQTLSPLLGSRIGSHNRLRSYLNNYSKILVPNLRATIKYTATDKQASQSNKPSPM